VELNKMEDLDTSKYLVINLKTDEIVNGFYHLDDAEDLRLTDPSNLTIYKKLEMNDE
jgi:hypothetical protein